MVADLNGWSDEVKAMELATSLRGNAQSVLTDLSAADRRRFSALVTALANRFEPVNQTEIYRAQLKSRQRRTGESLAELAQETKRSVRRAYPDASSDLRATLGRDAFVDALAEPDLEWAVYQGKPKTVDQALHLALEYEAFQKSKKKVRAESYVCQHTVAEHLTDVALKKNVFQ